MVLFNRIVLKRRLAMKKLNGLMVFAIFVTLVMVPLAYCADVSMHMDGCYGGSLDVSGNYQITATDPTELESFMDSELTFNYNEFSIYPSVSISGQLHEEINDSPDRYSWTISGNLLLAGGGESLNVEVYAKYIEEGDDDDEIEYFTPDSYLKVNGVSYPLNEDLFDILDNLTWCGLLGY